jgi:hypothetical protein
VSKETYRVYAARLWKLPVDCVREAIANLAELPRREAETAFPDLGTILGQIDAVKGKRERERRIKERKRRDEQDFWDWVDYRIAETGKKEQEILDAVKVPGYMGRRARTLR